MLLLYFYVGVLLCRNNRLLTGSNTRWLQLWDVEAVQHMKPEGKIVSVEPRSGSLSLVDGYPVLLAVPIFI